MRLIYPKLGVIEEDEGGCWEARCGCEGYIDAYPRYDAVVTKNCQRHKDLRRVKWRPNLDWRLARNEEA